MNMNMNLSDPDTFARLERQAFYGTVDVSGMPPAAYKYFSELAAVYRAYRFEGLPKEEAVRHKDKLLKDYHASVQESRRIREMYATYQDAIRRARTLTSEIEKSHSVDEIADKACMVIGLLMSDCCRVCLDENRDLRQEVRCRRLRKVFEGPVRH